MTAPFDPSYGFPEEAKLAIDKKLRAFVSQDNIDVMSVRPERQKAAAEQIVQPKIASQDTPQPTPQATPTIGTTVPVQTPSPTPMADAEAVSIDVPSKFFFYDFKDLYVKPFRVFHLAKLAKANETGSLQSVLEAVSSVLSSSTSSDKNLAMQLTTADFFAVLYWLRLNSFGKKTMRFESVCTDHEHLKKVEDKMLPPSTLKIITSYSESKMTTRWLENAPDPSVYYVTYNGSRIQLSPEKMAQTLQFMDHPNMMDEEFQWLAQRGSLLDLPPSVTFDERCAIVASLPPDEMLVLNEFLTLMDAYGIDEEVPTKCPECGASGVVQITVDAPSFLSPEF
jgi:hypothetical protein